MNIYNKKTQRTIAGVIVIVLINVMMITSFLSIVSI